MPCTAEFSTFYASCRAFHAPHGVIQRRHSFARSGLARVDGSFVHFPARNWKATQPSQTVARHFEPYSVCSQTLNASVKIWKFAARCFYHIVIVCLHWSENCQHFLNCVYLSVDYRNSWATNTKNNNRNINKAIQTVRAESCNILGAQKQKFIQTNHTVKSNGVLPCARLQLDVYPIAYWNIFVRIVVLHANHASVFAINSYEIVQSLRRWEINIFLLLSVTGSTFYWRSTRAL